MGDFLTAGRKPADEQIETVDSTTPLVLPKTEYNYAVVQFQEVAVGDFTAAQRIARYKVNGTAPTLTEGFIAGDNEIRIFTKGELNAGVQILSGETLIDLEVYIQYFNGQ